MPSARASRTSMTSDALRKRNVSSGSRVSAQEQVRAALVDAEPDEQQGQDQEVASADDEPLKLEIPGPVNEQARLHVEEDHDGRGERGLAPAPANGGREQGQDEEQEKRA